MYYSAAGAFGEQIYWAALNNSGYINSANFITYSASSIVVKADGGASASSILAQCGVSFAPAVGGGGSSGSSGLSGGAIAGIVIGAVVGVGLLCCLLVSTLLVAGKRGGKGKGEAGTTTTEVSKVGQSQVELAPVQLESSQARGLEHPEGEDALESA